MIDAELFQERDEDAKCIARSPNGGGIPLGHLGASNLQAFDANGFHVGCAWFGFVGKIPDWFAWTSKAEISGHLATREEAEAWLRAHGAVTIE